MWKGTIQLPGMLASTRWAIRRSQYLIKLQRKHWEINLNLNRVRPAIKIKFTDFSICDYSLSLLPWFFFSGCLRCFTGKITNWNGEEGNRAAESDCKGDVATNFASFIDAGFIVTCRGSRKFVVWIANIYTSWLAGSIPRARGGGN